MAKSFSFNSVDMSAYGLRLRAHEEPFEQETSTVQLPDKAYGSNSLRISKLISLDVAISASNFSTLISYLDSIKKYLNEKTDKALKIDSVTDRYWMVRFISIVKSSNTASIWEGTINFIAIDPDAYDNTPTSSDFTIDADPHSADETPGGTSATFPVFTLTADATLTDTTVTINNATTGEVISWTGDLVATDVLEIDTVTKIIKLNGTESMITVTGQFPRLLHIFNAISITGFHGTLNTAYSKRYV